MNQADILIIGVIYNTFPEAIRYLESLASNITNNTGVILVDNSDNTRPSDFIEKIREYPFLHYYETGENLGYFGGARFGLSRYLQHHTDYPAWILVTNVDIVFTPSFFHRLSELNVQPTIGVVAPAIISKRWGSDYNPQRMKRFSRRHLYFLEFLYSGFLIHNLYLMTAYTKKWISGRPGFNTQSGVTDIQKERKIYAPHGSCLIFSHNYFNRGGNLELPHFLFGEEIMVAETAAHSGLDIVYHPDLVIYDYEHASTGFFVTPEINRFYRQSVRAILDRYYR